MLVRNVQFDGPMSRVTLNLGVITVEGHDERDRIVRAHVKAPERDLQLQHGPDRCLDSGALAAVPGSGLAPFNQLR